MKECQYIIMNGQMVGRDCYVGIDSYYSLLEYDENYRKKIVRFVEFPFDPDKKPDEVKELTSVGFDLDKIGQENFEDIFENNFEQNFEENYRLVNRIGLVCKNGFLQGILSSIQTDPKIEFLALTPDKKIVPRKKEDFAKNHLRFIGFRVKNCAVSPALKLSKQKIIEGLNSFLSKHKVIKGEPSYNVAIDVFADGKGRCASYSNLVLSEQSNGSYQITRNFINEKFFPFH